jgi:uncharacterized NAD(P)/FAD-binding protein YdhS
MNKTVVVIGGGFSGTLTAIQLSRVAVEPICIYLVNAKNPIAKGIAYSTTFNFHLLNVRAKNMSVFPDDNGNFIEWLKKTDDYKGCEEEWLKQQFIPRKLYGEYLQELLYDELNRRNTIKLVNDEAVDISKTDSGIKIFLHNNPPLNADKVVLALGNFLPSHPFPEKDDDFSSSRYYIRDPWRAQLSALSKTVLPVLLIGTGLTTVDVFLTLQTLNFRGKIYIFSRNGYLSVPHSEYEGGFNFEGSLSQQTSLPGLYRVIKYNLKQAYNQGLGYEGVLDVIRKNIHALWQRLPDSDKRQFLRHLRSLWNSVRHRIPVTVNAKLLEVIKQNRVEIITGKITSIKAGENFATVKIKTKNGENKILRAAKVINCTGPQLDYSKIDLPLVKNLIQRKLIVPHKLQMGIEATPDGIIIQADGSHSQFLYTLGSSLVGVLWESIAVPELRIQAKTIAENIIKEMAVPGTVKKSISQFSN